MKRINDKVKQELMNLFDVGNSINGLANTEFTPTSDGSITEDRPTYNKAEAEVIYKKANSYIILGRDRMGGLSHGFGGIGTPNSNAIDIVVGMGSSNSNGAEKGKYLTPIDYLNKDHKRDAARIYISQRTDLDSYFEERMGFQFEDKKNKGVSGIAMKADTLLLQGRRNVKIKAYPSDPNETDAHESELSNFRIELIAGAKLEPVVKGDKLLSFLKKISKQLSSNRAAVMTLIKEYMKLRGQLMLHTHPTNTGIALPSPGLLASGAVEMPSSIEDILQQLNEEIQMNIDIINSLDVGNKEQFILSNRVFTS